ncbi:hypothetical protein [Bacillus tequilensis]|uniref:hypothetical protein n=1 Tax=Bacillus tequilensis TaxID=227866 RepID=UPI0004BA33CF|nr:hypothetical protein [Bacillus tequilensis]
MCQPKNEIRNTIYSKKHFYTPKELNQKSRGGYAAVTAVFLLSLDNTRFEKYVNVTAEKNSPS